MIIYLFRVPYRESRNKVQKEIILNWNGDLYEVVKYLADEKILMKKGSKYGYTDININELTSFYDTIQSFLNGKFLAVTNNEKVSILDSMYNAIIELGNIRVLNITLWGLNHLKVQIEERHAEKIHENLRIKFFQRESIFTFNGDLVCEKIQKLIKGKAKAKKNGKWGYIDESGNSIIPFEYDEIGDFCDDVPVLYDFVGEKASVSKNGKFGYIDSEGNELIDELVQLNDGNIKAKKIGQWGILDSNGIELIPFEYSLIEEFKDGKAIAKKGELYGYIDSNGIELIPFEYSLIEEFKDDKAIAKKGELYGY